MINELRRRKLARHFYVLDYDRNGYIERQDFEEVARNLTEIRGWEKGSPGYEAIYAAVLGMWERIKQVGGLNDDQRASLEDWLKVEATALSRPEDHEAVVTAVAGAFFDLVDADGDGAIGPTEYANFFRAHRLDPQEGREAFARLDTNGDGSISRAEMLEAVREYYLGDAPDAAGNYLFGPF